MARTSLLFLLVAGTVSFLGGLAPKAAFAGPNVPLCFAMQNNYNDCVRRERARERRRHEYEDEWGRGPYEREWGHRPHERRRRGSECDAWLVQLKAQGCF
ncbi:hypothetical protein FM996_20735 [Methylosinus sporium]|uniref:DUF3551 domain-containing protein n=1 Tax=Methylosinus sporium TaxID=428 RepID=A0A549SCY3_METSR|nr:MULTISPECIES: hypothetical protein [Methylosinus]MBU3888334.1 hypothetical protein [Methylosinus sp. KRF6]TRL23889.1 hypothetical protein FM996_20735 [Methylosinus sporium]